MRKILESLGDLTGKTVAITGTSGGLGYELCRYLVMKGATVLQMDRNPERQQKTAEKIKAEGIKSDIIAININIDKNIFILHSLYF